MCRQNKEGVEPTTSLIDTLRDEIGGEILFENVLILEGIVLLGVGHTIGK